jgi:uncharacterized protein (DUF2147 family)
MYRLAMKITVLCALLLPAAAIPAPVAITGKWVTQEKSAIIDIAPCGAAICGTITKFLKLPPKGADQRDVNNPSKALQTRKLLGLAILSGFKAKGDEWHGNIYDPNSGKTYRSVVYVAKSGQLIVKGCIGPFCQTQRWAKSS